MERTRTARGRNTIGPEAFCKRCFKLMLEPPCVSKPSGIQTFVHVLTLVAAEIGARERYYLRGCHSRHIGQRRSSLPRGNPQTHFLSHETNDSMPALPASHLASIACRRGRSAIAPGQASSDFQSR